MALQSAIFFLLISWATLILVGFFYTLPQSDLSSRLDGIMESIEGLNREQKEAQAEFTRLSAQFESLTHGPSAANVPTPRAATTSSSLNAGEKKEFPDRVLNFPFPPGNPYPSLKAINKTRENDLLFSTKYGVTDNELKQSMVDWLRKGGASIVDFDMLSIEKEYRGVYARKSLKQHDNLFSIPLSHLMHTQYAQNSVIGQTFSAADHHPGSFSMIAAYLLFERWNINSFWGPYIASLPKDYSFVPIFWNDSDLGWLNGSISLLKIQNHRASLQRYYKMVKYVPDFAVFSYDEWCWARTVVQTRAFEAAVNGEEGDALIAVSDMLNHANPEDTYWRYNDKKKLFEANLARDVPHGKEIHHSYGSKANTDFFVNYGFVAENNEENNEGRFVLELANVPDLTFLKSKRTVIGTSFECFVYMLYEETTLDCLSWARTAVFAAPAAKNMRFEAAVSLKSEIKVLEMIGNSIHTHLSYFPRTLQQDRDFLAQIDTEDISKKTPEEKAARLKIISVARVVKGEKEILHHYLLLQELVSSLESYLNGTIAHPKHVSTNLMDPLNNPQETPKTSNEDGIEDGSEDGSEEESSEDIAKASPSAVTAPAGEDKHEKIREWFAANVWPRGKYVTSYFKECILPLFPRYQAELNSKRRQRASKA